MVRSANMLVYEIIELYRATYKVTDSLDERLVMTWIQQNRARLLKQRFDVDMSYIDEHNVQNLSSIEMILEDSSVNQSIKSNQTILKSKVDIPPTLNRKGNIATFTRISFADRLQSDINFVDYGRAMVSGNGKFNHGTVYAYLDGKRICLISKNGLHKLTEFINIKGVFANPIEAYEFVNGDNSYDWDMEYPVSESIVADMKSIIVKENFNFVMAPMQDKSNNGEDDLTNLSKK